MTKAKREGFFGVDRGAFRAAALGGLNSAVAHLVMARGTARDNRTTQWSVNSITQRTGISRRNASKSVHDLLMRGIWKVLREGLHPIYQCAIGYNIPGGAFTADENTVLDAIRSSGRVPTKLSAALASLQAKSIVSAGTKPRTHEINEINWLEFTGPTLVWMPNAVVDGAGEEVPPIELIRQTRSLSALRLFVNLYGVQFLPHFGTGQSDDQDHNQQSYYHAANSRAERQGPERTSDEEKSRPVPAVEQRQPAQAW